MTFDEQKPQLEPIDLKHDEGSVMSDGESDGGSSWWHTESEAESSEPWHIGPVKVARSTHSAHPDSEGSGW